MLTSNNIELLSSPIEPYVISAERVAHVQIANNLEHCLLVLTKSGYTAIPVLDPYFKLYGLISSPLILDAILGLERIEFEKLEEMIVSDVMNVDIPRLRMQDTLQRGFELLIDHPFVCVEDEAGIFEGILTRRAILKSIYNKVVE
ncbi:cyclic-di-AMP-binding protein CbpB [Bacillus massiliigorillae]|uniref:cyclic-di-AMP-binding protein CbpB n=1 Tax=Bacillus massiliigorillae TaxID=1243664 RepID=UPI0003A6CD4D|nr:cyclic-di-AMP-binding protein CbpB [Bacillus massiliigorillae]